MKWNINNYIKILRPQNLVIVAISQFLIYWIYIFPLTAGRGVTLDESLWWLFIIDTVLIAAGGYVINDIYDLEADVLNKPEKIFIGPKGMSIKAAWVYYFSLVFAGFLIAAFIAYQIDKLHLLFINPVASILLYLYSKSWKKVQVIGNLVVATFCAFVPGIIWYAEYDNLKIVESANPMGYKLTIGLIVGYIVFAFFSTMVREMVKDIEDMEGDRTAGYNTLPIKVGVESVKSTANKMGAWIILSYGICFWTIKGVSGWILPVILVSVLAVLTIYILWQLKKSKTRADYSRVSKWLKILMVISLFVFLCIPLFINIT